ncbi:MAG: oxidoreductase [Planctomycetaceae bacterium]|nr:oxidoreductase [Planctomycetaceae bacterium]
MPDRPVAFITGASRGIGAATALEFAARGYDLALLARSKGDLESVAAQAQQAGAQTQIHVVDLIDLDAAIAAVEATVARFNRLDALINNAAWREVGTMRRITLEIWEKTLRIMLTAPAFLARTAAVQMEKQKRGVIVNVTSVMGLRPAGISPAYPAAKAALDALTSELAQLYGPSGVRVVSILPGAIDTEMSQDYESADGADLTETLRKESDDKIALQRWGQPEEIAKSIAWLASDDASYMTAAHLMVDGGLTNFFMPYSIKKMMLPEDF